MCASTGQIGVSAEDRETPDCPNDGTRMVMVTYRETLASFETRLKEELDLVDELKQKLCRYEAPYTEPDFRSLQELGRKLHAGEASVEQTLIWMKQGSCSVLLNWRDDDRDYWECSWIVGGNLFTGLQKDIRRAVLEAINKCFARAISS